MMVARGLVVVNSAKIAHILYLVHIFLWPLWAIPLSIFLLLAIACDQRRDSIF